MRKLLYILLSFLFISCTKNERARNFGGQESIILDSSIRLVNVTWKNSDLWILTKKDTTKPVTYYFKEKSNWGIQEGQIRIIEK
jgi:hypothetical protein